MIAKRILIIGAGDAGKMVLEEILKTTKISGSYNVVGFLDDDKGKTKVMNVPVLGTINTANEAIEKNSINEVIIAIPSASKETINNIVSILPEAVVRIKIVPGYFEIIDGSIKLNQIREIEPSDLLGREEVDFNLDQIAPFYKDKTIFITGAGGSIGSEIFAQLLFLPIKKIIAYGHGENSIHTLINKYSKDKRFSYVIGDIRDLSKLKYEISKHKPDIVFHAAAHKHVSLMEAYPDEAVKNNIFGTYNCAMASIESGVSKFLFISTDKAVNPTSIMGATKKIAERIVLALNGTQSKTKLSLTRFGNVLGSRGSVVTIFKDQIENGGPVTVTHPDVIRFFMSIREAARLVVKSATVDEGSIFVLDMGKPVKIVDLAKKMIKLYNYKEEDIPVVFTGLRKGEKMYEEVLTENENLASTKYKKLLVSKELSNNFKDKKELEVLLSQFKEAAESFNTQAIKTLIRVYVPEYIEEVDHE